MADKSEIEWTDATWNPVVGCKHVHDGCRNCYAEQHSARMERMGGKAGKRYAGLTMVGDDGRAKWTGDVREVPEVLEKPLRWRKARRVFVNSMSDLFHGGVSNQHIAAVFAVMAATPRHKYVILTKRPERARKWFAWMDGQVKYGNGGRGMHVGGVLAVFGQQGGNDKVHQHFYAQGDRVISWPLPNVAIGVSVSDQRSADDLIPHLLEIPAAVRILSAEPLLGPIGLTGYIGKECGYHWGVAGCQRVGPCGEHVGVDQVIIGAESGHRARRCDIRHAQNLARQVLDAQVREPDVESLFHPGGTKETRVSGPVLFVKQWTVCESCHGNPGDGWCRCDPVVYRAPPDGLGQVSTATDGRHTGQTGKLRKGCPVFYVPGHGAHSWAQMPEGWEL